MTGGYGFLKQSGWQEERLLVVDEINRCVHSRDVRPRGLASASRPKNLASASASASWVVASASASASWGLASASWVLASSLEASRGLQPKRNGMWLEVNQ